MFIKLVRGLNEDDLKTFMKACDTPNEDQLADLIVIDGNPLTNIRDTDKIDYTMINGRLFDAATMNEVGEKKREKLYFEKI